MTASKMQNVQEIIASLKLDMESSPLDDITVIERSQLEALEAAISPAEPVMFVSERQLPQCVGHYVPSRKTAEGNFQLALYRVPPAPSTKPAAWYWEDSTGCFHIVLDRYDVAELARTVGCIPKPLYPGKGEESRFFDDSTNPWKDAFERAIVECKLMAEADPQSPQRTFYQGVAATVDTLEIYKARLEDKISGRKARGICHE